MSNDDELTKLYEEMVSLDDISFFIALYRVRCADESDCYFLHQQDFLKSGIKNRMIVLDEVYSQDCQAVREAIRYADDLRHIRTMRTQELPF